MSDKIKTYVLIIRTTIVLCWISLFSFWLIKLFGGSYFEIAVKNDHFIKFSQFVENTPAKYFVSFVTIFIAKYITLCAICQKFKFKGKQNVIIIILIVSIWAISNFFPVGETFFPSWYAYLIYIIIGIIFQKGWKKLFGFLAIILEMAFSTLSMIVRNIPLEIQSNYLISFIFIFDLYIMTILYYLYSNLSRLKKEVHKNDSMGKRLDVDGTSAEERI